MILAGASPEKRGGVSLAKVSGGRAYRVSFGVPSIGSHFYGVRSSVGLSALTWSRMESPRKLFPFSVMYSGGCSLRLPA